MHYEQEEAELYDRVYRNVREDIPFWVSLAHEHAGAEGEALELACGTLRVLLPVAESGVRVTGIDESPHMLEIARHKLDAAPRDVRERVTCLQGDMKAFDLGRKFGLVYIPFNTLGLLYTIRDQLAMLDCVKRHLMPEGAFAFEVFMPDVERMTRTVQHHWFLEQDETFEDGTRLQRDRSVETDTRRQILSVTWRTKIYEHGRLEWERVTNLDLSYFFPRELEHLLARAGYEIVNYWGSYDRTPFWALPNAWRQIMVARPR